MFKGKRCKDVGKIVKAQVEAIDDKYKTASRSQATFAFAIAPLLLAAAPLLLAIAPLLFTSASNLCS